MGIVVRRRGGAGRVDIIVMICWVGGFVFLWIEALLDGLLMGV